MQMAAFKAKCPLEVGDAVAIRKNHKATDGSFEAYYIPESSGAVVINEPVEVHKVTDIACTHYLASGDVKFSYQLDNSALYVGMKVLMPIDLYNKALKHREK